jgi:hypothetical protein
MNHNSAMDLQRRRRVLHLTRERRHAVTVRFRTGGSSCCSDQLWNGRTTVLRREASTVYMGAGGTTATWLADTGATLGIDVWVHFSLDSMISDDSSRLADLVKMYP